MKKKILFLICLIIAGSFAYYGGYYAYKMHNPKTEIIEPENLQKAMQMTDTSPIIPREYYIGKIEQELLMIYKMPEEIIYDSVMLDSLQLYGKERQKLMEGMIFEDLTEVFEFLENSMS